MHRSRLAQIIIDCEVADLDAAAKFWASALGHGYRRLEDPEDAHYRQLITEEGQLNILLQAVKHPSRVHLDIESTDVEAEVRRLEALGARRVQQVRTWWVMEAPTGHRFCVLRPQRPGLEQHGHPWR
jgi:predicted enzyme related to lactoylglutathione lyase